MRINKIILFPIVILLITVSFAGIAAAAPPVVGALPTTLNATASVTTTTVNTTFTISGTLNDTSGGGGIAGATIQLQSSTDNVTFTNVTGATTVTSAGGFMMPPIGNYSFSNNESVVGTYYYRTTYAGLGSGSTQYYSNATSNGVKVTVTAQTPSNTNLTAVAAPTTVPYSTPFTISGTLSNATSPYTGITGATIQLQSSTDNVTFTNVPGATNVTGATGGYTFSQSEPTAGTYYYRTTYAGDAFYNGTTSNVVNVTVTTIGTTLNATVNGATSTSVLPSVPFTINGTLTENTTGAPIQNQLITLQSSTDNATWTTVNTTMTNSLGFYQFNQSQPVAGLYYYHTTYANNTVYSNAVSLVVTAQVGQQTSLNATVNGVTSTSVPLNTPFTISGTLNVTGGTGIYNQPIQLRQNESGTWTTVNTTTTDTSGNYAFSVSESAPGTYQFQTTYAGAGNLMAATSNVVTVSMGTTTLNATVNNGATSISTGINTNFTINGTLSNATSGIANATIQLQSSTDNVTFTNVPGATNVTGATGGYTFNQSEPTLNIYYFRTTYAGNTTLGNATSNGVKVTVNTVGTAQLSVVAAPTTVPVLVNFTVNGTLNDTSGNPIPSQTIQLQGHYHTNLAMYTTTDANGNYSFSVSEPTLGTYQFYAVYGGNAGLGIPYLSSIGVNVTVTNVTTQLTAAANVSTSNPNTPFTISGTLSTTNGTTPGPIANATINFTTSAGVYIANTTTNATGGYTFIQSEPTGTYHYLTTYAGNTTDYYANATSNVVTVQVGPPTTLTATANVTTTLVNTPFTINGTLSTPLGVLSGQSIALQSNSTGNWTTVNTTTTDSNGNYAFSVSEPTAGTYYYQTTYAGTASILPATSNTVSVNVTSITVVTPISSPAATGNYLFVTGSDNALWYKTWNGATWSSATSLGGALAANTGPAATSSGGVTYVFVTGTDNAVWYKTTTNGGWSGWQPLGGVLATGSSPAATSPSTGVIDVFAHGTDNAVWYRTTTSGWNALGGVLATGSSPAATSSGGVIDVFAHGTDNAVWYRTTTSGWNALGGVLAANTGPAATSGSSAIAVFALGTDSTVWQTTTSSGVWTSTGSW
jgi:large repetitive protein